MTAPAVRRELDPVTLAVISGALDTAVAQMTTVLEAMGRSPIMKLAHDHSSAVFDAEPALIAQGPDLPIHLGSLVYATKAVAEAFADDVHPGDVYYHNDPLTGGGHLQDMALLKPVFVDEKVAFWICSKAHMDDTGGSVAGGYNPTAEEIYAEGIRIPPLRIYRQGERLEDVVAFLMSNVRTARDHEADLGAQLAAVTVAEKMIVELVDRYGFETLRRAVSRLLELADRRMRAAIASMPDGVYSGESVVEDDGRSGEIRIGCEVEVSGEELSVRVSSPPQVRSYVNSYWANTVSAVYGGVMTFAGVSPPYNEGLYRAIHVDVGPEGTVANPLLPAPCSASTSTVGDNITEAVRIALSQALPERAVAGWARGAGTTQFGVDPRSDRPYTFNMIIGSSGGAGASWGLDGWHCLGIAGTAGGVVVGDVELLEQEYPIHIHRYELRPDSGSPGRWRGGLGPVFELEAVEHEPTLVLWGDGFENPSPGVLGSRARDPEPLLARKYVVRGDEVEPLPPRGLVSLRAGERLRTCPPGGGGVGPSSQRDRGALARDVRDGLVTRAAAAREYGVSEEELR